MKKINVYLIFLFDFLIRFLPRKVRRKYDVAIIRSDAIGDFVIFVSVLQAMRNRWKGQKMLLICPSQNKPLVEGLRLTDDVLYFDKKKMESNFLYHISIVKNLSYVYANLVINPTICHHLTDDLIVSVINSTHKVGTKVRKNGFLNQLCDKYYTKLISIPNEEHNHEMKSIEYFTQKTVDKDYKYRLSDLKGIYGKYVPVIKGLYCVIALSSSVKGKIWPKEKVADVINNIPNKYAVVLTGYGDLDVEMAQYLTKQVMRKEGLVNMVNKTTLTDLICLISRSSLVLGNDSASIHIAASCRVRSICYTSGAHFGKFVPYPIDIPEKEYHPICINYDMGCNGCNYHCKYVDPMKETLPCLNAIDAKSVINQMLKIL